jgi:uncharacterized protein YndB with AHSA1/START domain
MSATAAAIPPHKEFTISRMFDAPRDLVWKAWTDAAHLSKWWGPKGCTLRVIKLDFRPGGIFHYAMAFQPGQEMYGRFMYRDIVAPERMEYISSFSDPAGGITRAPFGGIAADFPLEVLNIVTMIEQGGKTTLTLRGGPVFASEAERKCYEGMFDSMQQGFAGTLDQLDEYLKQM